MMKAEIAHRARLENAGPAHDRQARHRETAMDRYRWIDEKKLMEDSRRGVEEKAQHRESAVKQYEWTDDTKLMEAVKAEVGIKEPEEAEQIPNETAIQDARENRPDQAEQIPNETAVQDAREDRSLFQKLKSSMRSRGGVRVAFLRSIGLDKAVSTDLNKNPLACGDIRDDSAPAVKRGLSLRSRRSRLRRSGSRASIISIASTIKALN
ncbi:hypothetical protein N656DRAFT_462888 [Canariomyces notabilis]|uniref:Uncharacterized protein n=1 Tax=Canariomyces notabilis TaxID=2074819 RepID=A0AAN6QE23_9PEZI|nr:hypothetical protein N656DRAFT_462888 [Canariomyces arenarius]